MPLGNSSKMDGQLFKKRQYMIEQMNLTCIGSLSHSVLLITLTSKIESSSESLC
jgi:hypothetical protein